MIDPLGLSLILFFGSILIIQMIGMLIHRFGTFAHILASVDFITSKRIVGEDSELMKKIWKKNNFLKKWS